MPVPHRAGASHTAPRRDCKASGGSTAALHMPIDRALQHALLQRFARKPGETLFFPGNNASTTIRRCLLLTALLGYGLGADGQPQPDHPGRQPIDFVPLDPGRGNLDCKKSSKPSPVCRVRVLPDMHVLESGLANGEHVSRRGDALSFVYRVEAGRVWLRGGLQYPLSWVIGTDLWALSLRIDKLDELAFSYTFAPDDLGPADLPEPIEWRGPLAAASPERVDRLQGTLVVQSLESAFLPGARSLSIYEPPALARLSKVSPCFACDFLQSAG